MFLFCVTTDKFTATSRFTMKTFQVQACSSHLIMQFQLCPITLQKCLLTVRGNRSAWNVTHWINADDVFPYTHMYNKYINGQNSRIFYLLLSLSSSPPILRTHSAHCFTSYHRIPFAFHKRLTQINVNWFLIGWAADSRNTYFW